MSAEVIQGHLDRGYSCAVNMDGELYAHVDGLTYPIAQWIGADGKECPKEDAVFAIAGRGFRWFNIHLGMFGIGPWASRYEDPAFIEKIAANSASVDRSGEADETATQIAGSAVGESAVPAKQGDAQS